MTSFADSDGVNYVFDSYIWKNVKPQNFKRFIQLINKERENFAEEVGTYEIALLNQDEPVPDGFVALENIKIPTQWRNWQGTYLNKQVYYKKYFTPEQSKLTTVSKQLRMRLLNEVGQKIMAKKQALKDAGVAAKSGGKESSAFEKPIGLIEKVKIKTNVILENSSVQNILANVYTSSLMGTAIGLMYQNTVSDGFDGIMQNTIPEAIIGPVPLYSIQSIERSRSDRIVKYRAIGDVFLAHQQGTKDSLRIDGTLTGPLRNIYLVLLQALQTRGEQRLEEIKNIATADAGQLDIQPAGAKEAKPMYEVHETFPIITRTSIMLDMYLQTIEWHQSVDEGVDCIKYHLLFRKYIEPYGWQALSTDDNDVKKFNTNYRKLLSERRRLELLYDVVWKTIRMGIETARGAWTGGKSGKDWFKETYAYAPMLALSGTSSLLSIIRSEQFAGYGL